MSELDFKAITVWTKVVYRQTVINTAIPRAMVKSTAKKEKKQPRLNLKGS